VKDRIEREEKGPYRSEVLYDIFIANVGRIMVEYSFDKWL
jgi:hypothetical protein